MTGTGKRCSSFMNQAIGTYGTSAGFPRGIRMVRSELLLSEAGHGASIGDDAYPQVASNANLLSVVDGDTNHARLS